MIAMPRTHLISESGSGLRRKKRACIAVSGTGFKSSKLRAFDILVVVIAACSSCQRGFRDALGTMFRRITLNQPAALSRHPVSQRRIGCDFVHCRSEL